MANILAGWICTWSISRHIYWEINGIACSMGFVFVYVFANS